MNQIFRLCLLLLVTTGSTAFGQQPFLIRDIADGSDSSTPTGSPSDAGFVGLGHEILFSAYEGSDYDNGEFGQELWKTDGTLAGTVLVKDIAFQSDSDPNQLTVMGNLLFFSARGRSAGSDFELWRSDGTEEGTEIVKDIIPPGGDEEGSSPMELTVVGDTLFFTAYSDLGPIPPGIPFNRELWKSDGTEEGTELVKDINPGDPSSDPEQLTAVGDRLFFTALDSGGDRELWKSDGTAEGTERVKDIKTNGSSNPEELTASGGLLFFSALDNSNDRELWKSDGTEGGTMRVRVINPDSSSDPDRFLAVGDHVFFRAVTFGLGDELWMSDGTLIGTKMVKDINEDIDLGSNPQWLTSYKNLVFFTATDTSNDRELWKTDGTLGGTERVLDLRSGGSSNPQRLTVVGDLLFFTADDGDVGRELWQTDGTEEGTVLVKDINPGGSSSPIELTEVGGRLVFRADDGTHGQEPWYLHVDTPRFFNISTRGPTGNGDNVMIVGFIVSGGTRRMLIRANGPGLDGFGVPDTLNDPLLRLFSGSTGIAMNDDWRDTQEAEIEASGFAPAFDVEPALIIELPPGPYTVLVEGPLFGTDNVLVDVFELE